MIRFGRPKNRWGWARIIAYAALAGVAAWTLLAAGLRGIGELPWLAWSGYQSFSWMKGLELAIVPLAAALFSGWLEEHEYQSEIHAIKRRKAEQIRAIQREAAVQKFRTDLKAVLAEADLDSQKSRAKISRIVWACLRDLDGRGKGEVLQVLFEHQLLNGEIPCSEMISEDFSGVDLTDARLEGVCLEGIDFSRAQMTGACLAKSALSGSILRQAILRQADLRGAVLSGSNLRGANLDGVNLEGADLRAAYLDGAFLRNANLKNCNVIGFSTDMASADRAGAPGKKEPIPAGLDVAILIDTILPDGRKVTNENGQKYLRDKEFSMLVDKL